MRVGQRRLVHTRRGACGHALGRFRLCRDDAVYREALRMELRLIIRHDADGAVHMQVVGLLRERPALVFKLFERPVEERGIVGLEMYLAAEREHVRVETQKAREGQAVLCIAALRPRVAEVYVDARRLAGGEHLRQRGGIPVDEADVGKPALAYALHRDYHRVRDLFHGEQQRAGHFGGGVRREAPLAAAKLDIEPFKAGDVLQPAPAVRGAVGYHQIRAFFHARRKVVPFSHSHMFTGSCPIISRLYILPHTMRNINHEIVRRREVFLLQSPRVWCIINEI